MKKTVIAFVAMLMSMPLFGQEAEQMEKMKRENLVPATIFLKGNKIDGYMHSITASSYDGVSYEKVWELMDEFKFLPKDSFDLHDKIRRKMYLDIHQDNCDGFIYDGRYIVDAVPSIAQEGLFAKFSKKHLFMLRLSKGAFSAYCFFKRPQNIDLVNVGKNKIKALISLHEPVLFMQHPNREYPSRMSDIDIEKDFAMYSNVLSKYKSGKYNTGRTIAENKAAFGLETLFANRHEETILNIIEDINSGKKDNDDVLPRSPFGFPAHVKLSSDSIVLSLSSNVCREYRIVGADEKDGLIRIATITKVEPSVANMYELSADVAGRVAKSDNKLLLYRIISFDRATEKCVDLFEVLFDAQGYAVAERGKTVADLARMYPTLLKESAEPIFSDGQEWEYDVATQRYYEATHDFGSEYTFKHPSRTDKFATRYYQNAIDNQVGLTTTIFSDDETKDNNRAYWYGYEVFLSNHKGEIISRKKIDFEYARLFKSFIPYQDATGRNIGQIIVMQNEKVKKHPVDPIEQRLTFIVVPYDGSEPYYISSDIMRKYDKGAEHIYGAMGIDKEVYVLFGSYTRGEENGVKEKPNKIGFLKLSPDGSATDLSITCMGDIDGTAIKVVGNGNKSVQDKKVAALGGLASRAMLYWYEFGMPTQVFTTQTKRIFVGYRVTEKKPEIGAPSTTPTKIYYSDLLVYTCDKETGKLEKVSVVYQAPSKQRHPIKIYDIKGDDFKILSYLDGKASPDFKSEPFGVLNVTPEKAEAEKEKPTTKKSSGFGIAGIIEIGGDDEVEETSSPKREGPKAFADGSASLVTPTITTFVNGVATENKTYQFSVFGNEPIVTCTDGTSYLISTKTGGKIIELDDNKVFGPISESQNDNEFNHNFHRTSNVRYINLQKVK